MSKHAFLLASFVTFSVLCNPVYSADDKPAATTPTAASAVVNTPATNAAPKTPAPASVDPEAVDPAAIKEFTWDDLIPADYRPEAVFAQMDVSSMQDGDPKAAEAMEKLRALWKDAPMVKELDGRKIKLGGFAVPLDGDGKITTEFLLVPYYGACIHVPPPPANQAILITLDKPQDIIKQPFDAVWVEGVIKIERFSNELADAGYAMKNAVVTPYEE
jgi:hypothetical protein